MTTVFIASPVDSKHFGKNFSYPKADSYAYEKLIRKWTKSGFFFGTKHMSEGHLMHTVLVCYVFDKLGQASLCG